MKNFCDFIRHKYKRIFSRKKLIKKKEEEGSSRGKDFKELPDDIVQLILQRLPLPDYLNCRSLSPCWRAAIDTKRWVPAAHQLPWLLHCPCSCLDICRPMQTYYIKAGHDYLLLSDRKVLKTKDYNIDFPPYCAGSIEGWLIMVSWRKDQESKDLSGSFFFLNPVSGARVLLPHGRFYEGSKAVASSVPTTTKLQPQQRSCYVARLDLDKKGAFEFCTPSDESWTFVEDEKGLQFWHIEILDEKLYAIGVKFVMVFDIQIRSHDNKLHTYTSERIFALQPNIGSTVVFHRNCYFAKCSESKDLFMIFFHCLLPWAWSTGRRLFRVFKLENVTTSPQWIEIVDLGDRAFFIGHKNNKCITSHDEFVRNRIYFVFGPHHCGVFSLTNKSLIPMTLPEHHSCHKCHGWVRSFWFTPNPW